MFYKKKEWSAIIDEVEKLFTKWHEAEEVRLPIAFDSEILNTGNRNSIDGWEWHDTPPVEYLDWKEVADADGNVWPELDFEKLNYLQFD